MPSIARVTELDVVPRLRAKADGLKEGEEGRVMVQSTCHHCHSPNLILGSLQGRKGCSLRWPMGDQVC